MTVLSHKEQAFQLRDKLVLLVFRSAQTPQILLVHTCFEYTSPSTLRCLSPAGLNREHKVSRLCSKRKMGAARTYQKPSAHKTTTIQELSTAATQAYEAALA